MRTFLSIVLVVALGGCGGAKDATTVQSRSGQVAPTSDPSNKSRESALRLGVFGDSYSNGEGVGIEQAWPTVMARRLTRDGFPVRVVANPSVTGATTSEMLAAGLGPLRSSSPDVMTVMLGVNDQVQGRTTEQFAADQERALAAAIEITGSAKRVIVVDIPDYSASPAAEQFGDPLAISRQIDAFNRVVRRRAARLSVPFVSIVDISRRLGADGISSDGLHPSEEQLAEWATRIGKVARRRWEALRREER